MLIAQLSDMHLRSEGQLLYDRIDTGAYFERAIAHVLKLDADKTQHCLGSAGTMAAGLWEFLRDAADSKQLHTAKAAADGLMAAYIARDGFTGAREIFTGRQGMAAQ